MRDLDPELETDREEDKRDRRNRHKDDIDSGKVVGFHCVRPLLFSNHLNWRARAFDAPTKMRQIHATLRSGSAALTVLAR